MSTSKVLTDFVGALKRESIRVSPPRRFVFFCGGKISSTAVRPLSLRDYLSKQLSRRKRAGWPSFVYAESATALYRDSKYKDLIAFEADIAQISDTVLLIAESPGSLTELGAFSMHPDIAPRLQVFIKDTFYNAESFINNGPLRHMQDEYPDSISYYPWKTYSDGTLKVSTVSPHLKQITGDIQAKLRSFPKYEQFEPTNVRHVMITIFWCIYIFRGANLKEIADSLALFGIDAELELVRKYLYCMLVAGWIGEKQYSHTVYFYNRIDTDPLDYAFTRSAAMNDPLRWKSDVREKMKKGDLRRPKPILEAIGT